MHNWTEVVCNEDFQRNITTREYTFINVLQGVIGTVIIFSILCNALVIKVFLSSKALSPAYILYANISLSDVVALSGFAALSTLSNCKSCLIISSYAGAISAYVSAYTMVLIAVKRYHAISQPFEQNHVTALMSNREKLLSKPFLMTYFQVCLLWIGSVLVVIWSFRIGQVTACNETLFSQCCAVIINVLASIDNCFVPYWPLVTIAGIPLTLVTVYSSLSVRIIYNRKLVGEVVHSEVVLQLQKKKMKAIVIIISIVIAFVACWLPVIVYSLVEYYRGVWSCDHNLYIWGFLGMIIMMSFVVNPILYWCLNSTFRQGLKYVIKSLTCTQNAPIRIEF